MNKATAALQKDKERRLKLYHAMVALSEVKLPTHDKVHVSITNKTQVKCMNAASFDEMIPVGTRVYRLSLMKKYPDSSVVNIVPFVTLNFDADMIDKQLENQHESAR